MQLPSAIWPLIRFTTDRRLMGAFQSGPILASVAWIIFAAVTLANIWLIGGFVG